MTTLIKTLTVTLFLLTITNAAWQSYDLHKDFHQYLRAEEDSVSHADRVFGAARQGLNNRGITRLGFRAEPGSVWEKNVGEFYVLQYTMAPIVLRLYSTDDHWVMMNYSSTPSTPPDLTCVEDFGSNLALYMRNGAEPETPTPDLGRLWHEKEGEWSGTWTRRENTATFDAIWTGPGGEEIRDEILFESAVCHQVVLFRRSQNGRYYGLLSDDQTRIVRGRADWFGPDASWSATIVK